MSRNLILILASTKSWKFMENSEAEGVALPFHREAAAKKHEHK